MPCERKEDPNHQHNSLGVEGVMEPKQPLGDLKEPEKAAQRKDSPVCWPSINNDAKASVRDLRS